MTDSMRACSPPAAPQPAADAPAQPGLSRAVASGSLVLLAESAVRMSVVAAVSFVIARALGPAQFGVLNFASALVAILAVAASLGLDTPVIVRIARGAPAAPLVGAAMLLRAAAGVIGFVVAAVVVTGLRGGDTLAVQVSLIVALLLLLEFPAAIDHAFRARLRPLVPALARGTATLAAAGAKLAVLALGLGVVALAWTVVLETALVSLGLLAAWAVAVRRGREQPLAVPSATVRSLWSDLPPYAAAASVGVLLLKIDVVLLGLLSDDRAVGLYSLAQKMSEVVYLVPVLLVDAAFPALARRLAARTGDPDRDAQLLADVAVAAAVLAAAAATVLAGPLVEGLFGPGYADAVGLFRLHVWSCIAVALGAARLRWLGMTGHAQRAFHATLVGLALNVALNLVLIPTAGATGAVVATLVSYFAAGFGATFLFPELRPLARVHARALWPWGRLLAALRRSRTGAAIGPRHEVAP